MSEMAWTSFKTKNLIFRQPLVGDRGFYNIDGKRIHPTQKSIKLYQWLLTNYAEPNFKILDTHLGSGSIAIAVDSVNKIEKMNLTLTACELDTEYYQTATQRIKEQTTWNSLF
jgi:site-specific DNA-methyltransferase (adenine-specific)